MPAKDVFHDAVKNALVKDGWKITDDPLKLELGGKDLYVDFGAEELLAAEREERKIAVEVKSFVGPSEMTDLERALGQYVLYSEVLNVTEPDRVLYLAIPHKVLFDLFEQPLGKLLLEKQGLRLIGFDPMREEIVKWTP